MADIPRYVSVTVDVSSLPILENIISVAFIEGYRRSAAMMGRPAEEQMSAGAAYEDWRRWGPGARMPGGSAYRGE